MRSAPPLAAALLFAVTPAFATGGFECRATDRSGIVFSGTTGHAIVAPLIAAHLQTRGGNLSTTDPQPRIVIGQSWIDAQEIRVDLIDPQVTRFEARLRARVIGPGAATGTLVRAGRTHPVRCAIE